MFEEFPKIPRWSRDVVVTEKIDGTNAQIYIADATHAQEQFVIAEDNGLFMMAGSRTRWVIPGADNHGFCAFAKAHAKELFALGPGRHFGEWWGNGINRGYEQPRGVKHFSLFNTSKWNKDNVPGCCGVVPIIYAGSMDHFNAAYVMTLLKEHGSFAVPGYRNPEGIVIYHVAAGQYFKKTFDKDETGKGQ